MKLFENLQSTWQEIRGFFNAEVDAVREIEQARFPGRYTPSGFSHHVDGFYDQFRDSARLYHDLHARFIDYENMDDYPELAATLDMYADEATAPDFIRNRRIWAESDNENIAAELNHLLHKRLECDDDLWSLTRYTCKYGNNYERLFINSDGVVATEPLPPAMTRRVHDEYGVLMGFVVSTQSDFNMTPPQFREYLKRRGDPRFNTLDSYLTGYGTVVFEAWEVIHFRLHGKDRMSKYGYSIFEPARWAYKRLAMMEDAVVVHKLTRAPSRYVFYVNTGDLSPQEAIQYTQRVRDMFKKQKFADPKTGNLNFGYNPLTVDEDFFIPVHREMGENIRVDTLMGPDYQAVDDVEYFLRKIGSAVKVPTFGKEQDNQDRPMAFTDVRFAAQVMRVQRAIIRGYRQLCAIHLVATGRDYKDFKYDVYMPVPSAILELARMEVMSAKADIVSRLESWVSIRWLLTALLGFSEDEATRLMVMREDEKDYEAAAEIQRDVAREVGRERALIELQRDEGTLGENIRTLRPSKISEREFNSGRSDLDPEAVIKEIRRKDPELYGRLNDLKSLTTEIKKGIRRLESKPS